MSSLKATKAKAKSTTSAKPTTKARATSVASKKSMSGEDKAAFVKAMWDGLPSKDGASKGKKAAASSATSKRTAAQKTSAKAPQRAEVLRKMTAPAAVKNTALSQQALAVAAALEHGLAASDISQLQPHALQKLMSALCRYYGAQVENDTHEALLGSGSLVTATDVMVVCGALLKAVDLQVFELGMWQAWSGR
jgi:hypothetical protein